MPSWIINQEYTVSRYGVKFHINETLTVSLTLSHHMSIRLTNQLIRAETWVFLGKKALYWQWTRSLEKSWVHRDGPTSEEKPFAMADVWGLFTVWISKGFKKERPFCRLPRTALSAHLGSRKQKNIKFGLIEHLTYFLYEEMCCTGTWCFWGSVGGRPMEFSGGSVPLSSGQPHSTTPKFGICLNKRE